MCARYRFTGHATFRNSQRVRLDPEVVLSELENGRCLPIGYEIGNRRKHLLFLNPRTQSFYVAVVDEDNGDIITILHADQDKYCKVGDDAIYMLCRELEHRKAQDIGEGRTEKIQVRVCISIYNRRYSSTREINQKVYIDDMNRFDNLNLESEELTELNRRLRSEIRSPETLTGVRICLKQGYVKYIH